MVCRGVEEENSFIFLNENEYAVGRRRPRGPNVNMAPTTTPSKPKPRVDKQQSPSIAPALHVSLDDQALSYYSTYWIESPQDLPEIADSHLKYTTPILCYSQPQSILSLAISAVSHATFGRTRKRHDALAVASAKYSKALFKMNQALKNATEANHDDVILAIMLLSFYENAVLDKKAQISKDFIEVTAARSFTHHDGAMAVLNLRRQRGRCAENSMDVDKLVRRQLIRSLLLRSLPVPSWLQKGEEFGELGFALELDVCMVDTAELRFQCSALSSMGPVESNLGSEVLRLQTLIDRAQNLDQNLVLWAENLPMGNWHISCTVQNDEYPEKDEIFDTTVHVYPTVGHAAMWNRYRALRLTINDMMLRIISCLPCSLDLTIERKNVKWRVQQLAEELCASIPYILGIIQTHETIATRIPASSRTSIKATTASLLAWPLAMTTMISGIPERHRGYLKRRLLDVSEIVDDGVLERVAASS